VTKGAGGLGLLISRLRRPGGGVTIEKAAAEPPTPVDAYWSDHTVNSRPFESARESEEYLRWRNEQYPLFPELMDMWGRHPGEVILDYGCGPGNDLTGYLLYSGAQRVIGVDVSAKALELAQSRLDLHGFSRRRVELLQTADDVQTIPIPDASVDYINCGGVIHHASHPTAILREFHRVLRSGGAGRIMVYNRNSIWFHLYVAYIRMIVEAAFPGLSVEAVFRRSTDGEDCPISIAYAPDVFVGMLRKAGFEAGFAGGYLSIHELKCWDETAAAARADERLATEHRVFIESIQFDARQLPMFDGKHAGIGGVYRLRKA
jgi:SAM-dependent methyltransferase